MKNEKKDSDLSIYCKQSTIESWYEPSWACGFASIMTAMRLLGNRHIQAERLPRRARKVGDGMVDTDVRSLVRKYGYSVRSFPGRNKWYADQFKNWLIEAWSKNHPTIVACRSSDDCEYLDHYICVYSNPEDNQVCFMDPGDDETVFSSMPWDDFLEYTEDRSEKHCFWEAHEIIPRHVARNGLPPSSALFDWINELPGDIREQDQDFVAAALVDNFFESIQQFLSKSSQRSIPLAQVLADDGTLWRKITEWEPYYDDHEIDKMRTVLKVLQDMDLYLGLRIRKTHLAAATSELALVIVHTLWLWCRLEE